MSLNKRKILEIDASKNYYKPKKKRKDQVFIRSFMSSLSVIIN